MALRLDILANTRQFVQEMKRSGASVEDISDALDDMARDGEKSGEKVEKSFREMAKEAKKTDTAVEKIGGDGFKKASQGAEDFKQEAGSSIRETAASIGSLEDGLGAVQEIAANAFVGFGPVGAGVGLVAALGFGLLLENLNQQKEAADELKSALSDAYKEAAEEGRTFLSEAQINAAAMDILFDPAKRKQAGEDAKRLGIDRQTLVRALAGDEGALNTAIAAGNKAQEDRKAELVAQAGVQANKLVLTDQESKAIGQVNKQLETQLQNHKDNQAAVKDTQKLEADMSKEQRDQIQKTRDADAARWSAHASAIEANKQAAIAAGQAIRQNLSQPINTTMNVHVNDWELQRLRNSVIPIQVQFKPTTGVAV